MYFYWKVRIYRPDGQYAHCEIQTERNTREIELIQDFYKTLTGCKMILEGMREFPAEGAKTPVNAFKILYAEHGNG